MTAQPPRLSRSTRTVPRGTGGVAISQGAANRHAGSKSRPTTGAGLDVEQAVAVRDDHPVEDGVSCWQAITSPEIGRHVCRPSSRGQGLVDLKVQGVGVDEDQGFIGVVVMEGDTLSIQ